MSDAVIIGAVIIVIVTVVAFFAGTVWGYGMRVREEHDTYRKKRIGSSPKHWHGHTNHKGCTIFSPVVKKGGIK